MRPFHFAHTARVLQREMLASMCLYSLYAWLLLCIHFGLTTLSASITPKCSYCDLQCAMQYLLTEYLLIFTDHFSSPRRAVGRLCLYVWMMTFSALTLLVLHQEEHPACKN